MEIDFDQFLKEIKLSKYTKELSDFVLMTSTYSAILRLFPLNKEATT